jgi:hypothetical protein
LTGAMIGARTAETTVKTVEMTAVIVDGDH